MTAAAWIAVVGWLLAGSWCVFVAWPFMRDTRRAAVEGLKLSIKTAALLESIKTEFEKAAPAERVEKALKAVESLPGKLDALVAKNALRSL